MEGAMIMLTRNEVITSINTMPEEQFKKAASYVSAIQKEDRVASSSEVANLTKRFNAKYEQAFRALAQ